MMASNLSIAMACEKACKDIDEALEGLGLDVPPLPRTNRRKELLRKIQLETIASALSQLKAKPKAKRRANN
jgi:hypothetical protein